MTSIMMRTPWRERVVNTEDGCLLWRGTIDRQGYGRVGGRLAHRVVYEIEVGAIPAGLTLDHLCRNRACVSPAHLEPVTIGENLRRGNTFQGRNARKTHCVNGHPFDASNTRVRVRIRRSGPVQERVCRTCEREGNQRRYLARKAV